MNQDEMQRLVSDLAHPVILSTLVSFSVSSAFSAVNPSL
jgi:hypothetical protein